MKVSRGTARNILLYSVANYLHTGINAVANIFVSNILGPVSNGIISYYNAITTNVNQVVFGTFRSAVEREVPQIEDYQEKRHFAQQSFVISFICALIVSVLFVVFGSFSSDPTMRFCSYMVAILSLVSCLSDFYRIWVKSLNRIPEVSIVMIVTSLLIPVFAILFSYWFQLKGFWIGRIILQVISLLCFLYASKELFKFVPIEKEFLKKIFVSGGEIVLFGLFTTGITTMDRFFVKGALGLEQLGYYAIGAMVFTMLMLVPTSITGAVYPKFVGMVNQDLKDQVKQYSIYIDIMCLIVSYIVYFTIPYLIKWVMPGYLPSIPIIQVLLVAFVVYASTQLRYMDIIRKKSMKTLIVYSGIAFILGIIIFLAISKLSDNIIPFAWGTNVCFVCLSVGVNLAWGKIYYGIRYRLALFLIALCPVIALSPLFFFHNIIMGLAISVALSVTLYLLRLSYFKI